MVNNEEKDQQTEVATENKTVTPEQVIEKINNNDFKLYFYCPPMNNPSGGINVIFRLVKTLQDKGFKSVVIYEPKEDKKASYNASQKAKKAVSVYEKFNPSWMGKDFENVKLQCLAKDSEVKFVDGTSTKAEILNVNPEDFLFIPEGFPNIMESVSQLPCKKIVLTQSWFYILNSMQIGQKWQHFGFSDAISVSDGITEYLNAIMPGLKIKKQTVSIDRTLFKKKDMTEKSPMIVYMGGRSYDSQLKVHNVIKTFYSFYPQYRWIRFHELRGLSKEDFAEQLSNAAFALYTDEIAGFGTLPLEAMACGTHVIGWTPLGGKEYMNEKNGFWTTNGDIFKLAELIGYAVDKYVTSQLDTEVVEQSYEQTLTNFTPEKEAETLINNINQYKNERISELQSIKK